jgi:rRNA processing protein Krr1/Pno1
MIYYFTLNRLIISITEGNVTVLGNRHVFDPVGMIDSRSWIKAVKTVCDDKIFMEAPSSLQGTAYNCM